MDGTIPRKRLGEVLTAIGAMETKYGLRCANVFHAGDGNLHPLILFDCNDPDSVLRAEQFGFEILELCDRSRRHRDGRARRRRRKDRSDVLAVRRGHARMLFSRSSAPSIRRPAEPGQGDSDADALRRVREDARARRATEISRSAALLMAAWLRARLCARCRSACAPQSPRTTPLRDSRRRHQGFLRQRACSEHDVLDPRAYCGVIDYEPTELVITARCGTPLAEVEATLAQHNQMLAFEPPHFGAGATSAARSRAGSPVRGAMTAGSVRDFVLGATLLDGRGDVLTFGGKVMKNVAGYDVSRVLAGSLGTLGVILDVSLKVLPRPATEQTLRFELPEADAIRRTNEWAGQPLPLSATAWRDGVLRAAVRTNGRCTRGASEAGRRWGRADGGVVLEQHCASKRMPSSQR